MNSEALFNSIITGFIVLSLFWLYKITKSYIWINNMQRIIPFRSTKNIFVLIPVLNESERIAQTVEYFRKSFSHLKNFRIVIVTTEAEYQYNNNPQSNTITVVKNLSNIYSNVIHYHYPCLECKMAHQLNYAIRKIISKNKDIFFAVYNADSRPHPKTVDWVLGYIKEHRNAKVFQQYGDYTKNINNLDEGSKNPILWSAACWQDRWSIGFEIPHALKQFKKRILPTTVSYPLNYCIGHGLFFTEDIFRELGGFSEDTHNEDAIFGLELSYLEEPIIPIPYFDLSDTPDTISGLCVQKSNWFFGPLEVFTYFKKIVQKRQNRVNRFKLLILSSKLFLHAVYWVLGPTMMLVALILALIDFSVEKIIVLLVTMIIFLSLLNFISWFLIAPNSREKTAKQILISFFYNLMGSTPFYILHGFSAYRTLIRLVLSKFTKRTIVKEKTPMIQT